MDHFKQLEVITALLLEPVIVPLETGKSVLQDVRILFKLSLQSVADKLNSDVSFEWLTAAINGITLNGPYEDSCWQFSEFGLKILLCFYDELKNAREGASSGVQMALPPDIISIQQQKDIQRILSFIVCLGISRNLLPGVGIPLHHRSKFADILFDSDWKPSDYNKHQMLFSTVCSLMKCTGHPSLGSLIISQHFGDLLAALCQLCYAPLKKVLPQGMNQSQENKYLKHLAEMSEDRLECHKLLDKLLEKAFQPLVFREVLLLQGLPMCKVEVKQDDGGGKAPLWLRKVTQRLFAERLMKKSGVHAGIQAILELFGENYPCSSWAKYDVVAQLVLGCCPKANEEAFFELVCPQILDLYEAKDKKLYPEFSTTATSVIRMMTVKQPILSEKYLISPLIKPLLICGTPKDSVCRLPTEEEFTVCITKLHQVFVMASDPEETFLEILSPVIEILLHIGMFLNSGISFLRRTCDELICRYFKYVNAKTALSTLIDWLFAFECKSKRMVWNSKFTLRNGTSGGIIITEDEVTSKDERVWQEDACKVASVISWLSQLHNDGIVMEFFLSILQDLTYVLPEPSKSNCPSHDARRDLINVEMNREKLQYHARKSLIIVEILSTLCEQPILQDSIMKDQARIINFVKLTLERSVQLCNSPVDSNLMESETITMALTILSMIGNDQSSEETKRNLKSCLPFVEVLAARHPEDEVRLCAKQLYMCIMTHGVFNAAKPSYSAVSHCDQLDALKNSRKQYKDKTEIANVSAKVNVCQDPGTKSKYEQACEAVFDPEPALKGHGLLILGKLILSHDEETVQHKEKVLTVFMQNLEHKDSYVYLMAIRGLASLADIFPDLVLPCLMNQYSQGGPASSPELRMKLGEALVKVTRVLGEIVPKYREPLLCVFMKTTMDPNPLVRASSLSNLGEVCKALKYSLGSCIYQVFNCIISFIKTDSSAEVRRAAIGVITSVFQGLEHNSFKVLNDILKDVYRLLKLTSEIDKDEGVKLHAQIALGELDAICRANLFPQQKLEKKIRVLDLS